MNSRWINQSILSTASNSISTSIHIDLEDNADQQISRSRLPLIIKVVNRSVHLSDLINDRFFFFFFPSSFPSSRPLGPVPSGSILPRIAGGGFRTRDHPALRFFLHGVGRASHGACFPSARHAWIGRLDHLRPDNGILDRPRSRGWFSAAETLRGPCWQVSPPALIRQPPRQCRRRKALEARPTHGATGDADLLQDHHQHGARNRPAPTTAPALAPSEIAAALSCTSAGRHPRSRPPDVYAAWDGRQRGRCSDQLRIPSVLRRLSRQQLPAEARSDQVDFTPHGPAKSCRPTGRPKSAAAIAEIRRQGREHRHAHQASQNAIGAASAAYCRDSDRRQPADLAGSRI